jgi:asparagine synthase (glutamine-hydrolysing)
LPPPLRALAAGTLARLGAFASSPDRFRKASAAVRDAESLPHPYFFTRLLFTPQAIAVDSHSSSRLLENLPWWKWLAGAADQARTLDQFTKISWLELRSYLLNTLLRDTDAMSMRNSLEVRVPFLDTPLVEYVISLPQTAKIGAFPKALLIAALNDILPAEIVVQKKRTFTFPWEEWLRGSLGKRVAAGLDDWSPALEPHVARALPSVMWKDYLAGRTTWSRPWSLYVLNEWAKQNLSANRAGSADCRAPVAVP